MKGPSSGGLLTRLWWPWFRAYVSYRLRKGLDTVMVEGLSRTAALAQHRPLLLASNHVAWWDALLLIELKDALGVDGRCLMDAGNLARLPFFRAAGALPLDRSDRAQGQRDLEKAARWLCQSRRSLWVFPQGRQQPSHWRPLGFRRGIQQLAEQSGALVVPVGIEYGFRQSPRPAAVLSFGEPLTPDTVAKENGLAALEGHVDLLQRRATQFLAMRSDDSSLQLSFQSLWNRNDDDRLKVGIGARLLGAMERQ